MRVGVSLLLAAVLAAPAGAQVLGQLRRGSLKAEVPVAGRAQPYNAWPAFAPFDGRVQTVLVLPGQWVNKDETLLVLVDKELGAMLDSEPTTPPDILAKRWGMVYRPFEVKCPFDNGYVVNVLVRDRQQVRTGDPLLTAAQGLKIVSSVPPELTAGLEKGAHAVVWTKKDPDSTYNASVLEVQAPAVAGAGSHPMAQVTVGLPPRSEAIDSGTELEGRVSFERKDVLKVPESAIRRVGDRTFVTIELRLGADNGEEAEVLSGMGDGTTLLMPESAKAPAPSAKKPKRDKTPVPPPQKEDPSSPEEVR